jgi:hypothetical protein
VLGFEELCIRVLRIVVRFLASGGSTVVKHPTHQPKVEGLSPAVAAAGTGSGQLGIMTLSIMTFSIITLSIMDIE